MELSIKFGKIKITLVVSMLKKTTKVTKSIRNRWI